MRNTPVASLLLAVALLLGSSPVAGQGWTLDLYGGRVAYDLAASTPSENGAILGVRYRQPDIGWLYLSSGVPFGSNDSPWGAPDYKYAFRSPSGEWYVPESIPSRMPDGMGGFVAVLVIS